MYYYVVKIWAKHRLNLTALRLAKLWYTNTLSRKQTLIHIVGNYDAIIPILMLTTLLAHLCVTDARHLAERPTTPRKNSVPRSTDMAKLADRNNADFITRNKVRRITWIVSSCSWFVEARRIGPVTANYGQIRLTYTCYDTLTRRSVGD